MVKEGWSRSSLIRSLATPLLPSLQRPGYGTPGTQLHGIQFRESILASRDIILRAAIQSRAIHPSKAKSTPLTELIQEWIEAKLVRSKIAQAYSQAIEKAYYGPLDIWTESEYLAFMKLTALLLQDFGYDPHRATDEARESMISSAYSDKIGVGQSKPPIPRPSASFRKFPVRNNPSRSSLSVVNSQSP